MPIHTSLSSNAMNKTKTKKSIKSKGTQQQPEELDTSQLSAYAVYNGLIPGIKSYEDTSESTHATKQKKNRKKKKKVAEAALKKENAEIALASAKKVKVNSTSLDITVNKETTKSFSDDKNSKKKRKAVEAVITKENEESTHLVSVSSAKKAKGNSTTPSSEIAADRKTSDDTSIKKKKKNKKKNKSPQTASKNKTEIEKEQRDNLASTPKKSKAKSTILEIVESSKKKSPETKSKKENGEGSHLVSSAKKSNAKSTQIVGKKKTSFEDINTDFENLQQTQAPANIFSLMSSKPIEDSVEHGKSLFDFLIHPLNRQQFMSKYWEKAPFLSKRVDVFPDYFQWIMTTQKLDDILRNNVLKYNENIDVVVYENGVRETVSKEMQGRARPAVVWDYYSTGHSIRILNPQTYCKPLWRLNASLQEMFGCFVGANVYLTPPDSQGFAPHYDDIEAFILQVEGKKQWKLYKPRTENEKLPRFSSKDFNEDGDLIEAPIMDVTLEEGDILYFPRGTIHQAKTVDGHHSMHITLSCYQQNTYGDLLKQHFTKALEKLVSTDVKFREGLPLDYLSFMGLANSENKDKAIVTKRKEFKQTLKKLMSKVLEVDADEAADAIGKKFIWDSLPPYFTRKEKEVTVEDDGEFLNNGRVRNRVEFDPDVEVKLLRKNCIRLLREESVLKLYFSIENPMVYHQEEPQFLEIPEEFKNAVEYLIKAYPAFTKIDDLPVGEGGDETRKIQIVSDLWERGILMTKTNLQPNEFDEDFDMDDGEEYSSDELEEEEDDDDDFDMEEISMDDNTDEDEESFDDMFGPDDGLGSDYSIEEEKDDEGSQEELESVEDNEEKGEEVDFSLSSDEEDE